MRRANRTSARTHPTSTGNSASQQRSRSSTICDWHDQQNACRQFGHTSTP